MLPFLFALLLSWASLTLLYSCSSGNETGDSSTPSDVSVARHADVEVMKFQEVVSMVIKSLSVRFLVQRTARFEVLGVMASAWL